MAASDQDPMDGTLDLTVAIPALKEGPNLEILLPDLQAVLRTLGIRHEILVITRSCDLETAAAAGKVGAIVLEQRERGYGGALLRAFETAQGHYLLTMDADLSHPPRFVADLWRHRESGEVVIASRWVEGGGAEMPLSRHVLSCVLNTFFRVGLSLPARDLSSGFRLYKLAALRGQSFVARDFNILQEILVAIQAGGGRFHEVPFQYAPRGHGASNARVFRFGLAYLASFVRLWKRLHISPPRR